MPSRRKKRDVVVGVFETRAKALQGQADAHRELSSNLAHA